MRCPTCHQPIPNEKPLPRVCYLCEQVIEQHDKWMFVRRAGVTLIRHRHCDAPDAYVHNGENRMSPWQPPQEGEAI